MKTTYIYLNHYSNSKGDEFYYVGSHTWDGPEGQLDPAYHGTSYIAKRNKFELFDERYIETVKGGAIEREGYWINFYADLLGIADIVFSSSKDNPWIKTKKPHGSLINCHANDASQVIGTACKRAMEYFGITDYHDYIEFRRTPEGKAAFAEYDHMWNVKDSKRYWETHREECRRSCAEYRKKNYEEVIKKEKEYNKTHRKQRLSYLDSYRAKQKELAKELKIRVSDLRKLPRKEQLTLKENSVLLKKLQDKANEIKVPSKPKFRLIRINYNGREYSGKAMKVLKEIGHEEWSVSISCKFKKADANNETTIVHHNYIIECIGYYGSTVN